MDRQEVIDAVTRLAGGQLEDWERGYLSFHAARYADTLAALGPGQGRRLLDAGAFPGHLTLLALEAGWRPAAVVGPGDARDSQEMIRARLEPQGIEVVRADVEQDELPFESEAFAAVLATEIIEHLPYNPFRLLREAFRVLEPGGFILLSTPNQARLPNRLRLLAGRSIHERPSGRYDQVFPANINNKHVREFTAQELAYLLGPQNKEVYAFAPPEFSYSGSLDQPFAWRRACVWAGQRLRPAWRGQIFARAAKPPNASLIAAEAIRPAQGLHQVERHEADMNGIVRQFTTPFRWTAGQARLGLPDSGEALQAFTLHVAFPAPWSLAGPVWTVSCGRRVLGRVAVPNDRQFAPLTVALPRELAADGRFELVLEGPTWRPDQHDRARRDYEFSLDDPRELGIVVGWGGVLRTSCADADQLTALARRQWSFHQAHGGAPPQWAPALPLFLPGVARAGLAMGKGEQAQLGLGWHHLEDWGEAKKVRWTGRRAEAFVAAGRRARRLVVHCFSGVPELGPGVEVRLAAARWDPAMLAFTPLAETTARLEAGQWADLSLDLPPEAGGAALGVVIETPAPRIPAQVIAGSQDQRELGLAVTGLEVR